MKALRLGTRGSALALWQARTVAERLASLGYAVEIATISTRGDRRQAETLVQISAEIGKGVFTKEIQDALLREEIDLAVHSAKDLSAVPADGLAVSAALEREDPRDALVLPGSPAPAEFSDSLLAASPTLGTGSPRRVAQLRRIFPAARFDAIRGNVDTRLRKLDEGAVDALVLACAGLRRLGFAGRITAPIPTAVCVPAPGQGIIAVETRASDERINSAVSRLNDVEARLALAAEQSAVADLGGGCQLPLGVHAEIRGAAMRLRAVAASVTGDDVVSAEVSGDALAAHELGRQLAAQLAARGAGALMRS